MSRLFLSRNLRVETPGQVIRLTAAPRAGAPPTTSAGGLTSACYLATTSGNGVDCVRAVDGSELWIVRPPLPSINIPDARQQPGADDDDDDARRRRHE
jgi:hypothetical protein